MTLRVGSLFTGIGGIDLGLEWAGMSTAFQVEWDPYCSHILESHWPTVPRFGDIHDVRGADLPPVDVLAGGFPCQPISAAGSQRAQADDRWLWPQFARLVGEVRPAYVIVENVPNLRSVNRGTAFGDVLGDMAQMGFDAGWLSLGASDVGAPHRRLRCWIIGVRADVADAPRDRAGRARLGTVDGGEGGGGPVRIGTVPVTVADPEISTLGTRLRPRRPTALGGRRPRDRRGPNDVPDPDREQHEIRSHEDRRAPAAELPPDTSGDRRGAGWTGGPPRHREGQTEPPHGDVGDTDRAGLEGLAGDVVHRAEWPGSNRPPATSGVPRSGAEWWAAEPPVGRVAHGIPRRVDRLRALGNAVVPKNAEVVGRMVVGHAAAVGYRGVSWTR